MFCINEKDILNVYKEEGKIKEYNYCKDYLRFMNQKTEKPIKDIANKFCVTYNILLKWKRGDSCPYGIKCLTFLKKRNLLPYYPNERTARIVGFLHGDGCLCNNLLNFCFISKDKAILLKLKKDVEQEFQINGKLKKKRDKGDIEFIHKKYFIVRHPTYEINFNSKAISSLLFKLGVPKGKKIYQKTFVPSWVMNGGKNIQKAFLQGLFDSELSNPRISTFKGHKDNLSDARMDMCKIKDLENNLREYLTQLKVLLEKFKITSKVSYLREYNEGKISLTLSVHNKLSNLYHFVEKIGLYYNIKRKEKSLRVKELALEKIKNKNCLFKVLEYCKCKDSFTLKELEKDLNISSSYTNSISE